MLRIVKAAESTYYESSDRYGQEQGRIQDFGERGGLINIFTTGGRIREGRAPSRDSKGVMSVINDSRMVYYSISVFSLFSSIAICFLRKRI